MTLSRHDLFDDVAVRLDGVSLRYDSSEDILSGIDLVLKPGSFSFLTGASGAGKTSLLKLLYLALKPTRGEVSLFGRPTSRLTRDQLSALRRRVGVVFQEFRLLDHLTAYENVALPLRVLGRKESTYRSDVEELLAWVGLGERMHARPTTLSGGEQQMLAISRALLTNPELLLLDEPTEGLAPLIVDELVDSMRRINEEGMTLLLVEQNLRVPMKLAHRQYVVDNGTVQWSGTTADLLANREEIEKLISV